MIHIITDSTACFSEEEVKQHKITMIPIKYKVKGRGFFENYRDKNGDFLNLINSGRNDVATEQIHIPIFKSTFEPIIRNGGKILCMVLSSRLSGSYHNALLAAKEYGEDKVIVVDSMLSAGGLKLLVEKAGELLSEYKTPEISVKEFKSLASDIEKIRDNIGVIFSVESMEHLEKGGRLSYVRKSINTALNIRPILKCEKGAIISLGIAKGFQDQINKIISYIPEAAEKIIVNCNNDIKKLWMFKTTIEKKFSHIPIIYNSYGPVLYTHIGRETLVVNWITSEEQ